MKEEWEKGKQCSAQDTSWLAGWEGPCRTIVSPLPSHALYVRAQTIPGGPDTPSHHSPCPAAPLPDPAFHLIHPCPLPLCSAMPFKGLVRDAITYSTLISALAKGRQWGRAIEVFNHMVGAGVEPDAVTCCALLTALDKGGQWGLAEQVGSRGAPCWGNWGGGRREARRGGGTGRRCRGVGLGCCRAANGGLVEQVGRRYWGQRGRDCRVTC